MLTTHSPSPRETTSRRTAEPIALDPGIWRQILAMVRTQNPGLNRVWFDQMSPRQLPNGMIQVVVQSGAQLNFCQAQCAQPFTHAAQAITGRLVTVSFHCENMPTGGVFNEGDLPLPLNPDYTFENFVTGPCNRLPHAACVAVADAPGKAYNPLFIHGGVGLGKTHLSQAVGHYLQQHRPEVRVLYLSVEDFTNEMVQALQTNAMNRFKEKYRNRCDVLLLEDIHFLAGKERTQIELALALDYLFNADKKIIFTSCYLPSDIPKLNDQLKSRLAASLISNIEAPDFDTRLKILMKKSKENGLKLPKNVIDYLAGELSENVRQLESGLIGVTAKASLMGKKVDMGLAKSVVRNIVTQSKSITVDTIKEIVCNHYGISSRDLISNSRKQMIVRPRQIAIYLARKYTDQPLQVIGKNFNRYHATAIHSIGAVEQSLRQDPSFQKQVEYLCGKIESSGN